MGPKCYYLYYYKREAKGDLTQTEEDKVMWLQKQQLELYNDKPKKAGSHQIWKRLKMDSPIELLEEVWLCQPFNFSPVMLISDFWPLKLWGNMFL